MIGHGALNVYSSVHGFDFGDADLIEMFIRHCSHTSYFSSLFFIFVMHFSGRKKVTENIIDDSFPNWQGII